MTFTVSLIEIGSRWTSTPNTTSNVISFEIYRIVQTYAQKHTKTANQMHYPDHDVVGKKVPFVPSLICGDAPVSDDVYVMS